MDLVVPECEARGDHPQSRAAACVTRAVYEIAEEKGKEPKDDDVLQVDSSARR
jgi:hypothetical protein